MYLFDNWQNGELWVLSQQNVKSAKLKIVADYMNSYGGKMVNAWNLNILSAFNHTNIKILLLLSSQI